MITEEPQASSEICPPAKPKPKWLGWLGLGLALGSFCTCGISAYPAIILCLIALIRKSSTIVAGLGFLISLSALIYNSQSPILVSILPSPVQDVFFKFQNDTDFHPFLHLDGYHRSRISSAYHGFGGSEGILQFERVNASTPEAIKQELTPFIQKYGWALADNKPEYLEIGNTPKQRIDDFFRHFKQTYEIAGWGTATEVSLKNDLLFERPLAVGDSRRIYLIVHIFNDGKTVAFYCDGAR